MVGVGLGVAVRVGVGRRGSGVAVGRRKVGEAVGRRSAGVAVGRRGVGVRRGAVLAGIGVAVSGFCRMRGVPDGVAAIVGDGAWTTGVNVVVAGLGAGV